MGHLPTSALLFSCLLLLFLQQPCEAEQCLVDADTCTDSSSCKIGSSSYCCNAGYVVHAVSMNGELVTCACNQESGSNTGYRCTIRSDESGGVSVTSASWLTCALTLLFALMSV